MQPVISLVSLVSVVLAAACGQGSEPGSNPEEWARIADPEQAQRAAPQEEAPRPNEPAQRIETDDQRAPERYTVRLDTTEGPILIDVTREWAPHGADRFYTLVREGYLTDVAFFRVIDGFMAQAGIHGDPAMNTRWRNRNIPDDRPSQSNTRGMVSYAMAGPGTRTTQFFINFTDNSRLDAMGFAPFGQVRDMTVVDKLHSGYGEGAPRGRGPDQSRIQREGNTYLRAEFPDLDYIERASIVEGE